MSDEAAVVHPPPPHAGPAAEPPAKGETSEKIFARRLRKALLRFNIGELRAMWKEELLEPHMHLFVMLVLAFGMGILIWLVFPF
jgi:hypothetical protein